MKRTCDGCRALEIGAYEMSCSLGFRMDVRLGRPLERCPKPKTYMKLFEEMRRRGDKLNK